MVDDRDVGIRRVGVERLTLGVVVDKLLISIDCGEERGSAHSAALLGHERLHPLEVVRGIQLGIIHVVHLLRVVLDGLVEAGEGVVEHGPVQSTGDDLINAKVKAVVVLEAAILNVRLIVVKVHLVVGATETLLLPVLVDAPQIVDTFIYGLLVAVLAQQ